MKANFGSGETSLDGVYAVGDIVRGASPKPPAILEKFNAKAAVVAE